MAGNADGHVLFDTKLDSSGVIADLNSLAGGALKAALAGLTALGGYAIKVGSDFEATISQVSATMGDSAQKQVKYMGETMTAIEAVEKEAARLGKTTSFSASEAASGFNILAMSGLSAEEQIAAMGNVLDLAAAGALSLEEAASFTTGTIKGFNDSAENAQKYVDLIAKGATLANTDVRGLGEALSQSAAAANANSQSVEGTTLALLRLAEQNVTGSEAATALNRVMTDLFKTSGEGAETLKKLGVDAYDPVTGKARDLNTVIDELNAALDGMSDAEANAYKETIFSMFGLQAFNKMTVASTEKVNEFKEGIEGASDAMDGLGSAHEQAEKMLQNLQGRITIFKSALEGFGNSIYKNMAGPLTELVEVATEVMSELTDAIEGEEGLAGLGKAVGAGISKIINKIAGYAPDVLKCAVDLVKSLVSGLSDSAPEIAKVVAEIGVTLLDGILTIGTQILELVAKVIVDVAHTLTDQAPRIIEVLTTFATTLAETVVNWLPQIVQAVMQLITSVASSLIDALPILIDSLTSLIPRIVEAIVQTQSTFIECVAEIIGKIASALPQLISQIVSALPALIDAVVAAILQLAPKIINCGIQLFTQLIKGLPEVITTIVAALPDLITSIVGGLLAMLPMIVDCGVKLFVALVQALPQIIGEIVRVLPQIIAAIVQTFMGMTGEIIQTGIKLLTSLVSALPQIILAIVAAVPAIIAEIVAALLDNIPLIIDTGIQLLTALITALPEIIAAILMAVPQIITSLVDAIISNAGVIAQAGVQLLISLVASLPQIIASVVKAVPQIVQAIIQAFTSFRSSMAEAGSNLLHGLADGIGNAIGSVVARAREAAANVVNSVKSRLGIASPSKVFRDEVGKNMMLGLAEGVDRYSSEAVDAAKEAAEEIADVDYKALAHTGFDAVSALRSGTGKEIGSGNASASYTKPGAQKEDPEGGGGHPEYIVNVINVDGRETARIITPYVAEEMEWEDK